MLNNTIKKSLNFDFYKDLSKSYIDYHRGAYVEIEKNNISEEKTKLHNHSKSYCLVDAIDEEFMF